MSEHSQSEALARAVAADLTAGQFSLAFVAKYDPMPSYDLSDLSVLRLNVRDAGQRSLGRGARGHIDYEYAIEVTSMMQVGNSMATILGKLKLLAEEFADHFMFTRPTGREETIDRVEVAAFVTDEELQKLGMARFTMTMVFFGHRNNPE